MFSGISGGYRYNNSLHWRRFINYCILYDVSALPTTEERLCQYAAYRYESSTISGESFKNELYGIASVHLDLTGRGLEIKKEFMPKLGRIRSGWARARASNKRHREPVTSKVLKKFLLCLDPANYDHQTLRALLCFAKFGLLRVSEYTYGRSGNAPTVGDLAIIPDMKNPSYMVYTFNKSKCNQLKKKERVVCICTCPEPCAVHEMVHMLAARAHIDSKDPLFWLENGDLPTNDGVNNLIKNLCRACGLDGSAFCSHQLRSGGTVDLLCLGVPDSIVQELARWANLQSMVPYKKLSDENLATALRQRL